MALPTEHWRPTPLLPRPLPRPGTARRLNTVIWSILLLLLLAEILLFRLLPVLMPLPQPDLSQHAHPGSNALAYLFQVFSTFLSWGLTVAIPFYAAMAIAGFGLLANLVAGLRCWQAGRRTQAGGYLAGFVPLATVLVVLGNWC